MAKYGLLVDAQWCSGCHSCEIACQMEHGLPVGETGIKVVKIGPWVIGDEADEDWQFSYLPIPTKQCDTCAKRRGTGKVPTCVQHCQSKCLDSSEVQKTIDAVTGATWGTRNRIMAGLFQRDLRKHGDDMPAFAPPGEDVRR